MRGPTVVLFDDDCGFCRWSAAKILAWDRGRRIRAVALQDPEADVLLSAVPPGARRTSWHLVDAGGRVHSGGAATSPLMRLLPGGRFPAALASAFPGATEFIYRWAAARRDRLGRLVGVPACSPGAGATRPGEFRSGAFPYNRSRVLRSAFRLVDRVSR